MPTEGLIDLSDHLMSLKLIVDFAFDWWEDEVETLKYLFKDDKHPFLIPLLLHFFPSNLNVF